MHVISFSVYLTDISLSIYCYLLRPYQSCGIWITKIQMTRSITAALEEKIDLMHATGLTL